MRTNFFIKLLVLIFSNGFYCAQNSKVVYDFYEKDVKFTNPEEKKDCKFLNKISRGGAVIYSKDKTVLVNVCNFNPLRYNLSVHNTVSPPFHMQQPASLKLFNLADNTGKADNKDAKSAINSFKIFNNALVNLDNVIVSLVARKKLDKNTLEKSIKNYVSIAKNHDQNCDVLDCTNIVRNRKQELIDDLEEELSDFEKKLKADRLKLDDTKKTAAEKVALKQAIQETEKSAEDLKILLKEVNNKISSDQDAVILKYAQLIGLDYELIEKIALGDADEIKLEVKGYDNFTKESIPTQLIGVYPISKKFKISFSTGGFWATKLYDEDFTRTEHISVKEDNEEIKTYSLNILDGGKDAYGAMGFINFHSSDPSQLVNYGAALGVGLIFNQDTKIVMAPNLVLVFGHEQRVLLHVGYAFAQVERIKSKQPLDYTGLDIDYNPEKKKEVQGSFMMGLSWNLTK